MRIIYAFLLAFSLAAGQSAQTIIYRAVMSAQNEPVTVADPNASGIATIWMHLVNDPSGSITSGSLDYQVSYKLTNAPSSPMMQIRQAAAGKAGPVVLTIPLTGSITTSGSLPKAQIGFSNTDANPTTLNAVSAIVANPGGYYFEIASSDSPPIAMRGQLQPAQVVLNMALLSPANEAPPLQGVSFAGTATVICICTFDQITGVASSGYFIFDLNYSSLPVGTGITSIALHSGIAGANGPIVFDSGLLNPISLTSNAGNIHLETEADLTRTGASDAMHALFNNPSSLYLDVVSTLLPTGILRAQLRTTDQTTFNLTMTPDQIVPIAPSGLTASATTTVTVYTLRNADGSIPAGAMVFDANPRFPAGTSFSALQLRDNIAGLNGDVSVDSNLLSAPVLVSNGGGNIWRLATVSSGAGVAALNDLTQAPEKHYMILSTASYPNGAVRAQLLPSNFTPPAIAVIISAATNLQATTAGNLAMMSIFGTNLVKTASTLNGFPPLAVLPTSLNGASVTIGGVTAPIQFVEPGWVMVQVPATVPFGNQPVVIHNTNGASPPFMMPVAAYAPNIYFDNTGGAVLKGPDYSLVRPNNPVSAGQVLVIYCTGLGQTTPPLATGLITPTDTYYQTSQATVNVGGMNAQVIYSIATPGYAGLYQVAAYMPSGIPAGNTTLQISIGGATSNIVQLAVK